MNLKNIKLESYIITEDFFLYDIQGEMEGSIEVQFDNNEFNGNILYCENDETIDGEWIRVEDGDIAYVGITDFAQHELGDIVFVDITTEGETLEKGEVFGSIEAVKTVSDVLLPVAGEVLEVNAAVGDDGEASLVNNDPYGEGWLVKIRMTNPSELNDLMDAAAYVAMIGA